MGWETGMVMGNMGNGWKWMEKWGDLDVEMVDG